MLEFLLERANYWVVIVLMMIGLYITFASQNLIKRMVGLGLFQTTICLFYVTLGKVSGGTAPILFGEDAPYKYGAFVNNTASEQRWYIERVPELVLEPECSQFQIVPGGGGGAPAVGGLAAAASGEPRFGSSPLRYSPLRPFRATRCTLTLGPRMTFAPLLRNSAAMARAHR